MSAAPRRAPTPSISALRQPPHGRPATVDGDPGSGWPRWETDAAHRPVSPDWCRGDDHGVRAGAALVSLERASAKPRLPTSSAPSATITTGPVACWSRAAGGRPGNRTTAPCRVAFGPRARVTRGRVNCGPWSTPTRWLLPSSARRSEDDRRPAAPSVHAPTTGGPPGVGSSSTSAPTAPSRSPRKAAASRRASARAGSDSPTGSPASAELRQARPALLGGDGECALSALLGSALASPFAVAGRVGVIGSCPSRCGRSDRGARG